LVSLARRRRAFSRKSERGTTVLVTVMVTMLLTSIGIFAIRNISKVDQAVGFSRQSAQTLAIAELGTTVALAQIASKGAQYYADRMDEKDPVTRESAICDANGAFPRTQTTCDRLNGDDILKTTATSGGVALFEPTVSGSETGSFGPLAGTTGQVSIELTEKFKAPFLVPGEQDGATTYVSVTMTSTGEVRAEGNTDKCVGTLATSKKVMRAHTIIGPVKSDSP
jgi:hypothetical protein